MSPVPWLDAVARLKAASLVPPDMIEWPNTQFQIPEPSAGPWLSVQSVGDVLDPMEVGDGAWLEEGRLFVHVMVPAFSGTLTARQIAKGVANTFRGLGQQAVRYMGASIGAGEHADEEGTLWRLTVVVDWKYQD